MIDLERDGDVFTLTMDDGENRWNTTFVRILAEAIEEIEGSEGPAALDAGLVQHTASPEDLLTLARTRAEALAPLGTHRKLFKKQKESIFGENAAVNGPHGAAYMLAHNEDYSG